jgi:hypothetical protein
MTFEQVDKHVNSLSGPVVNPTPGPVTSISQLCPYWKAVSPIVVLVGNLPIIPAQWKAVINAFVNVMNQVCP